MCVCVFLSLCNLLLLFFFDCCSFHHTTTINTNVLQIIFGCSFWSCDYCCRHSLFADNIVDVVIFGAVWWLMAKVMSVNIRIVHWIFESPYYGHTISYSCLKVDSKFTLSMQNTIYVHFAYVSYACSHHFKFCFFFPLFANIGTHESHLLMI